MNIYHATTSKTPITHAVIFTFDLTEDDINDNITIDERFELATDVHSVNAEIITKTDTSLTAKYSSDYETLSCFLEEICGLDINDVEVITL